MNKYTLLLTAITHLLLAVTFYRRDDLVLTALCGALVLVSLVLAAKTAGWQGPIRLRGFWSRVWSR